MPKQLTCPQCNSTHVVKHTKNKSGTQRYRCRDCKKTFTPVPSANPPHRPKKVVSESTIDLEVCRAIFPKFEWKKASAVNTLVGVARTPEKHEITVVKQDRRYFVELSNDTITIVSRKSLLNLEIVLERMKEAIDSLYSNRSKLL